MKSFEDLILEEKSCPLGCDQGDEKLFTGRDRIHDLPGEFNVMRCCGCGLIRTNPRPTPKTIGLYYPDNYGPYIGTRVQDSPKSIGVIKKLLKLLLRSVFNFNQAPLPYMKTGRLLEIGCASGSFMHKMFREGWQVQGIEFSEKAALTASQLGHSVHCGPLETAPKPAKPFDLIVGWMVLEHLHDPVGGLKKLREWANPEARLVISVPNAAALSFDVFEGRWYDLHLPNHLYHFTPSSIEMILSAGGWTLEKVHHHRVLNNIIASMGYVLRDKGYAKLGQKFIDYPDRPGRWADVLYPIAWFLSIFGQTGRMTVWARVKSD